MIKTDINKSIVEHSFDRRESIINFKMSSKNDHEIVAAIDFGTTYSGYAYSYKYEQEKIFLNKIWPSGSQRMKEATAILFNDKRQFVTFGQDAINKYSEFAGEEEEMTYYFFRNFKMSLYDKESVNNVNRQLNLTATNGKTMKAMDVFSSAIEFLKNDLIKTLNLRNAGNRMKVDLIRWVLTVPAIWSNSAKQFMRESAEQAGIPKQNLVIALEPECASFYCRNLPKEKFVTSSDSEFIGKVGVRYLILDNGGGTVDTTIHEVMDDDHVREVYKATGGAWGGTKVDELFVDYLATVFSDEVIQAMKTENASEWVHMMRDFEQYKRTISVGNEDHIKLLLQPFCEVYREKIGVDLVKDFENNLSGKGATVRGKRLQIQKKIVEKMIEGVSKNVRSHAQFLMGQTEKLHFIMMVGGFSNSPIVVDMVKKMVHGRVPVIVPEEPELSILRGAVQFGWQPDVIKIRRSRRTYGIGTSVTFIDDVHPPHLMVTNGEGVRLCDKIFRTLITVNQEIQIGHIWKKNYRPVYRNQEEMSFSLFESDEEKVEYYDNEEKVRYLGQLKVLMPIVRNDMDREVIVEVEFGQTEIILNARDRTTGNEYQATFDFLT